MKPGADEIRIGKWENGKTGKGTGRRGATGFHFTLGCFLMPLSSLMSLAQPFGQSTLNVPCSASPKNVVAVKVPETVLVNVRFTGRCGALSG